MFIVSYGFPSNYISRIYGLEFAFPQSGGLRLTLWTGAKKELASFTGAAAEKAHGLVLQDADRMADKGQRMQAE